MLSRRRQDPSLLLGLGKGNVNNVGKESYSLGHDHAPHKAFCAKQPSNSTLWMNSEEICLACELVAIYVCVRFSLHRQGAWSSKLGIRHIAGREVFSCTSLPLRSCAVNSTGETCFPETHSSAPQLQAVSHANLCFLPRAPRYSRVRGLFRNGVELLAKTQRTPFCMPRAFVSPSLLSIISPCLSQEG